jgi:hypothetical protein
MTCECPIAGEVEAPALSMPYNRPVRTGMAGFLAVRAGALALGGSEFAESENTRFGMDMDVPAAILQVNKTGAAANRWS